MGHPGGNSIVGNPWPMSGLYQSEAPVRRTQRLHTDQRVTEISAMDIRIREMMARIKTEEEAELKDCSSQSDYTDCSTEVLEEVSVSGGSEDYEIELAGELDSLDGWELMGESIDAARGAAGCCVFQSSKSIAAEMAVIEESEMNYMEAMRDIDRGQWSLSEVEQKWPQYLQQFARDPQATTVVLDHAVCGLLPWQFRPEFWSPDETRVSGIIREVGLQSVMARVLLCVGMQLQGTTPMDVDMFVQHSEIYNRGTRYSDYWKELYQY